MGMQVELLEGHTGRLLWDVRGLSAAQLTCDREWLDLILVEEVLLLNCPYLYNIGVVIIDVRVFADCQEFQ